ncbi:MAG: GntR family transcriptional regulator [Bacteroidales bacterium]|nr:GntR family transcriptional regulator [Bacteroidales bacterium]
MEFTVKIDVGSKEPIYKQLLAQFERAVRDGRLAVGDQLPSMNDLAASTGISKETVKKAYGILGKRGLVVPKQGKGFYVADLSSDRRQQVLVLFDKFSVYKQIIFNTLAERLGDHAELTILTHNQSLDLFTYYLDTNLDRFDYYVVTPHFPLDEESQARAVKQIARIPNRKLVMLDRLQPGYPGHYGAIYQDFENDIYYGLTQGLDGRRHGSNLKVITLPQSLYGASIRKGVERFCTEHAIPVEFLTAAPEQISRGTTFLVLNSQLDEGLVDLARRIDALGLKIGTDVRIISYNESDMNEIVLNGLTTVSTDWRQMGRLAADMILERRLSKVHCDFRMIRRNTF